MSASLIKNSTQRRKATEEAPMLSRAALQRMLSAGREVTECLRVLESADLNLVGECIEGHGTFFELEHYPPNDVHDTVSHSQYYYHAHRSPHEEHGHFHTFLRGPAMPSGARPMTHSGTETWPAGDEAIAHLVAISMDAYGRPVRLFTTNRWVTAETLYPAVQVVRMLDRFRIDHANPSWPLNRWLGAMLVLFRPQIEALLRQRDQTMAKWAAAHPERDVFEDRELEITSSVAIDIDRQIAEVSRALNQARHRFARRGTAINADSQCAYRHP